MAEPDDGGPAFPHSYATPSGPAAYDDHGGMTLRDWFAGQAMSALAEGAGNALVEGRAHDVIRLIAGLSYRIADAMVEERARGR